MTIPAVARVVEAHALVYRRTWRGSVISTFFSPVLYLVAMGIGLGSLVDQGSGQAGLGGLSYLAFLAPGLLVAAAMQTGAGDGSWPVMAGIKWTKTYHATLATPVGIRDLVVGHLGWVGLRLTFVSVVFVAIMAAFGAVASWAALAAVIPAVLTGLAFAAATTAYAAYLDSDTGLSTLFRFGIVPMFLFSGTFFPISSLPAPLEFIAWLTPLWHGVTLCRDLTLADVSFGPDLAHLAYLLACVTIGLLLARTTYRKRLVV